MRIKINAFVFIFTLTTLSLSVNFAFALTYTPQQEAAQAVNTAQAENSDLAPIPSTPPEKKTNNDAPNIAHEGDEHHHHVVINAPTDAFKQQQQDIEHYLSQEQVENLTVGEDNYLTIINNHTTKVNKGVMVLIPDWQQSIATPNALKQIRENMPELGWTTLTLHPPHKPDNYPSKALTSVERIQQNAETLTNYHKKFTDIMLALMEKAKHYPGVIIVVAQGNHSAVLLDLYQQDLVAPPSAFIMLSSYMPTLSDNKKIAQQLALSDYPILDLFLKRDHNYVISNALLRRDEAKRELKIYYRQKQLNNQVTGYYPKHTLTEEILGWLSALGW